MITALLFALLAGPAGAAWRPPVGGALARPFAVTSDPFAAGQHRGIDLRAASGAIVRAPCTGRVLVAGRVGTSGGVVTLLCGRWRVSHLPLATIAMRAGTPIARGARLGTLATGFAHIGLHLGVRRDGDRFGYVDPLRFLAPAPSTPFPPLGRAPHGRRHLPSPPATAPVADRATRPLPAFRATGSLAASSARRSLSAAITGRVTRSVAASRATRSLAAPGAVAGPLGSASGADRRGLAPWPAWLGLALVLAGAGVRWRGSLRTRTRHRLRALARLTE